MSVIIETSLGEFTVDLYCEERPRCCENFLKLCKLKYYNYCLFHSIQTRLVAQTGDPSATGTGGNSMWQQINGEKYFMNEIKPKIKHGKSGLISMVNNGQNQHGSQFFITLADNLDYLDGVHTVFGEIAEGIEIVEKLNKVFIDKNNIPLREVRIYHTIVLDDPFDDHPRLLFPERSPEPTENQLVSNRIGAEEDINDDSGLTEEEKQEIEKIKEARTNAQILTVIGDIPDEDIKPPENVLFVCSLNPITNSEDLEVIFSRFGEILSCEVIRDYKTGNSLQYAFIEFELKKSCEEAYFSMERVLIDDRRIHVDFSQSVAKQWKSYKDQLRRRKEGGNENSKRDGKPHDGKDDNSGKGTKEKKRSRSSSNRKRERSKERKGNESNRHKRDESGERQRRRERRQSDERKYESRRDSRKDRQRERSYDRDRKSKDNRHERNRSRSGNRNERSKDKRRR